MKAQILTEFLTNFLRRPGHIGEKADGNGDAHFAEMVGAADGAEPEDAGGASMPVSSVAAPPSAAAEVSIGSSVSMSNAVVFRAMMPAAENASAPVVATPEGAGDTARPRDVVGALLADGNGKAPESADDPRKPSLIATGAFVEDAPTVAPGASILPDQKSAVGAGMEDVSGTNETSKRDVAAFRAESDRDAVRKGADVSPLATPASMTQLGASVLSVSDANSRGASMEPARISVSAAAARTETTEGRDNRFAGEAEGLAHIELDVETGRMGAVEIGGSNSGQPQAKNMAGRVSTASNTGEDFAAYRALGIEPRVTAGASLAASPETGMPRLPDDGSMVQEDAAQKAQVGVIATRLTGKEGAVDARENTASAETRTVGADAGAKSKLPDVSAPMGDMAGGAEGLVPLKGPSVQVDQEQNPVDIPVQQVPTNPVSLSEHTMEAEENTGSDGEPPVRRGRSEAVLPATTGMVSAPASGTAEAVGASRRSADLTGAELMTARAEFVRALQSLEEPVVLRTLPEPPSVAMPKLDGSVEVAGEGHAAPSGEQIFRTPAPEVRAKSAAAVTDAFSPALAANMTSGDNTRTAQMPDLLAQVPEPEPLAPTRDAARVVASDAAETDLRGADMPLSADDKEMPRVPMSHRPLLQGDGPDTGDAESGSPDLEAPREKSATAPSSGRETETGVAVQHSAQTTTGPREAVVSTLSRIPASFGEAALLSGNAGSEGGVSAHMSLTGHSVHALQGERQAAATASGVSQQITQAMSGSGDRPVELTLSPEELGKVRLTLHSHDATITVAVQAERTDTLDLLRRNIDLLARDFREIGYGDVSFSFGEQASGGYKPDSSLPDPYAERESDPAPRFQTASVAVLSPVRDPSGGLDLRM
ncbi:MAG: flagellar hook-length control protein FliK [Paenirhodobacter sp.]|uniref:flagellar hook-length control protein FliK n=1 Tax=Paenirhodobacter sp. TaxID=1965326 RepID=UPI003D0FFF04